MNPIPFFVRGHPEPYSVPAQVRRGRHGNLVAHHYPSARHAAWQESVVVQALPHKPAEPWEGGIVLWLEFRQQRKRHHPKDWRRCKNLRSKAIARRPIIKPDLTKLARLVEDALTKAHFWRDDGQVVEQLFSKRWCKPILMGLEEDDEGFEQEVWELEEEGVEIRVEFIE